MENDKKQKEFYEIFAKLSLKHSAERVFVDYLDLAINQFRTMPNQDTAPEVYIKRYGEEERLKFGELIHIQICCLRRKDWHLSRFWC